MSKDTPRSVGISGAKGGLCMPFILPTITCPPTSTAPELPAETNASASLFLTIFMPTTIDDCFFRLIATTGGSAISITSGASIISICSLGYVYKESSLSTGTFCPIRNIFISFLLLTASTAPFTTSAGALSPPIASSATLVVLCIVTSLCLLKSKLLID